MNVLIMRYRLDMGDFDSFTLCLGAPGAFFILFYFLLIYFIGNHVRPGLREKEI